MLEVIELLRISNRPAINIQSISSIEINALIDTGAVIGITYLSSEFLREKFNGIFEKESISFSGFGGSTTGELWRVTFKIGNIIYPDFPVIRVDSDDYVFDFIIPATAFSKFRVVMDNLKGELELSNKSNQVCYNVEVQGNKFEFMCMYQESETPMLSKPRNVMDALGNIEKFMHRMERN